MSKANDGRTPTTALEASAVVLPFKPRGRRRKAPPPAARAIAAAADMNRRTVEAAPATSCEREDAWDAILKLQVLLKIGSKLAYEVSYDSQGELADHIGVLCQLGGELAEKAAVPLSP